MERNAFFILMVVCLCTIHLGGGLWAGILIGKLQGRRFRNMRPTLTRLDGHLDEINALGLMLKRFSELMTSNQSPLSFQASQVLESMMSLVSKLGSNVLSTTSDLMEWQKKADNKHAHVRIVNENSQNTLTSNEARLLQHEIAASNEVRLSQKEIAASATKVSKAKRFQFCRSQYMAPIYNETLPCPSDFFKVECAELSSEEITFYTDKAPNYKRLVISLGNNPELKFMEAEVVDYRLRAHNSDYYYLVECLFLRRITENEFHWNAKIVQEEGHVVES